jgi:hypothetical protein
MAKVPNKFLAQMAAHTIKGNNTASTANPIDLTATQVTAELNVFTSGLKGLVPSSGGGTTNFLRADGSFAAPPGTGATITSWTSYTPTFTNTGTDSNVNFSWRQVGPDSIDITGTVDLAATGNTSDAQISLPTGLTASSIFSNQRQCGSARPSSASGSVFHSATISGDAFFVILDQNNANNVSGANAGGNTWTFHITSLPVTGL